MISDAKKLKDAKAEVDRLNKGLLPRYCTAELSRHAKICDYYRQIGRTGRIRMREAPGSPAFFTKYASLMNDAQPRLVKPPDRATSRPHTWRWICERYFQSIAFRRLASDGQRIRRRMLEATYEEPTEPGSTYYFQDCPLDRLRSQAVRVLRDRKIVWENAGDGKLVMTNCEAANSRLKYIRGVFAFGKEDVPHLIDRNWAKDVDYFASGSEGFHPWSLEQIAQYEDCLRGSNPEGGELRA